MNAELPPVRRYDLCLRGYENTMKRADDGDYCDNDDREARERILKARIEELEADAERYRVALVDCMEWMESGRASTDWGFWDWKEGDVYMRAKAAIDAAREGK